MYTHVIIIRVHPFDMTYPEVALVIYYQIETLSSGREHVVLQWRGSIIRVHDIARLFRFSNNMR